MFEMFATVFNISANVSMTTRTYMHPETPVPISVILLQMLGNLSWIIYSVLINDKYLLSTTGTSFILQGLTLRSLCSKRMNSEEAKKNYIKSLNSEEELPKF